jgi:outer membrane protein assembly factor BamB
MAQMLKHPAEALFFLMAALSFAWDEKEGPALPQPQIKWKIELNYGRKQIAFGPDGTLYVATSGHDAVLTALTPAGKVLWSWVAHGNSALPALVSQPKFDRENNLLTVFEDRLVKLSPDGRMLWARKFYTATPLGEQMWMPSWEVAPDGTTYVATAFLNAYSAKGDLLWQFRGTQPVRSVRIQNGNIEASDGTKIYLISPEGQKIRETTPGAGFAFAASEGGIDYKFEWLQMEGIKSWDGRSFNALVAQSEGKTLWEFGPGLEIVNAVPQGATVFVGGKVLAALDRRNGSIRWRINTANSVPVGTLRSGVIGGCEKGSTICAYTRDGKLRWAFVGNAKAWFAPPATVAVGPDETIYIGDNQNTLTALRDVIAHQ